MSEVNTTSSKSAQRGVAAIVICCLFSIYNTMYRQSSPLILLNGSMNYEGINGCRKDPKSNWNQTSSFSMAIDTAYRDISINTDSNLPRNDFVVENWTNSSDTGGLKASDRILLAAIYRNASSVFEWGIGESTTIAQHVGVPRYSGVDSSEQWLVNTRGKVSPDYRFYLADIGEVKSWGYPKAELAKNAFDYQVAPLMSEPYPFDVYLVDGRYRLACLILAFLHASWRGANNLETTVLVHDCFRMEYHLADDLLLLTQKSSLLCVYKRKPNTTDDQLYNIWKQHYTSNI